MDGAKTLDQSMQRLDDFEDVFFSEQFLQTRPLCKPCARKPARFC